MRVAKQKFNGIQWLSVRMRMRVTQNKSSFNMDVTGSRESKKRGGAKWREG